MDLKVLLRRVLDDIQPRPAGHMLELQVLDEPLPIFGDQLRLDQVPQNLLTNAIKYSPARAVIAVTTRHAGLDDGRVLLARCVTPRSSLHGVVRRHCTHSLDSIALLPYGA